MPDNWTMGELSDEQLMEIALAIQQGFTSGRSPNIYWELRYNKLVKEPNEDEVNHAK